MEAAQTNYEEALQIRRKLAQVNPHSYSIPLADSHLCLSNLYRYNLVDKASSIEHAQQAVDLYGQYPHVPYAVQWKQVALDNLTYWEKGEDG